MKVAFAKITDIKNMGVSVVIKIFSDETMRKILENFSSYEGTVTSFCKENNMSKSQFYYYKKRFEKSNKPTFHAIALKNDEFDPNIASDNAKVYSDIKIEIGKANIYIPANEIALLSTILKEIVKSC